MIYGFKKQGDFPVPDWALVLKGYYWFIRNEARDKSQRRRYYRLVMKEKLRLVELGFDQELVESVCRYLVDYSVVSGQRMHKLVTRTQYQLSFIFFINNDI